jgi:2',3'-cyclic-nucleotide 2'-phosphodiesterase (5'-nucleotidase family)
VVDASVRRLPLVSANVSGPGIARWRIVERGGLRVGITGIAAAEPTLAQTAGYTVAAPETALATVRELAAQADVVVLLAWHAPEAAKAIATAVPEVDVVVDGNRHRDHSEPFLVGNAVWAWSFLEAQRLGELRLDLEGGRVVGALDRKIDLDPSVAEDKAIAELAKQAAAAVDAALLR